MNKLRIKRVDAEDEETFDLLCELHKLCFGSSALVEIKQDGFWWVAFDNNVPVAFAGFYQSPLFSNAAYLSRTAVLPANRKQGISFRLVKTCERAARKLKFDFLVSDTTHNTASANTFIKRQWKLFDPKRPWAFAGTLYWYKQLRKCKDGKLRSKKGHARTASRLDRNKS